MDLFHWSPNEIDDSDIETLMPIVFNYPAWKLGQAAGRGAGRELYADEAGWL